MTAAPRTGSAPVPNLGLAGCTCARLRKLTRRVSQHYDQHLAAAGLRVTQYSLLSNLAHNDGATITALARTLGMDRTTLVRNLKPLEQAGFLEQGAGVRGNERAVSLTAAGRAVLRRARPLWSRAEKEVRATLGADTITQLHALIDDSIARLKDEDL
jgi:DNA-binding MarR family transcriptional regulator